MKRLTIVGAALFALGCGGADTPEKTMPVEPTEPTMTETEMTEPDTSSPDVQLPLPTSDAEVVYFAFDSEVLTDEGKAALADEIAWLKENPRRHIILHGYTDDVGDPSFNLTLGNARANAVRTYMNAEGIDLVRLHVVSHGEQGPELPDDQERRAMFVGTIKK